MQAPTRKFVPRTAAVAPQSSNATLPSGPTVLLEDSQVFPLGSQTPVASQMPGGGARANRGRTILTQEAEEEAIQLTSEGKITTKNAWNIKLLEGIYDSVSNALSSGGGEESASQFTKCANLVEGGAKIWTQRVEHTAAWSNQVLRRLQRNDDKDDGDKDRDAPGDGDGVEDDQRRPKKAKRKIERTVAECLSEINIDAKAKAQAQLSSSSVSAQFRAITEKFEQGHAQGLLLNNAPMGSLGNLILDIDYSRDLISQTTPHSSGTADVQSSPSRRPRHSTALLAAEALSPPLKQTPVGHAAEQDIAVEQDDGVVVKLQPPSLSREWGSGVLAEGDGKAGRSRSGRLSGGAKHQEALQELLVPNTLSQASGAIVAKLEPPIAAANPFDLSPQSSRHSGATHSSEDATRLSQRGPVTYSQDDDESFQDYGGDMNDYDEEGAAGTDESNTGGPYSRSVSRAASSVRDLVSGAADLAFFDRMMAGGDQLALAAEDPHTWFPMSQSSSGGLPHHLAKSQGLLERIRKEKLVSQQTQGSTEAAKKKSRVEKQQMVSTISRESIDDFLAMSEDIAMASSENKIMHARRDNLKRPVEEFRERFLYKRSTELARENAIVQADVSSRGALPWWLPADTNDVASFFQPFSTNSVTWNVLNKRIATMDDAIRLITGRGGGESGPEARIGAPGAGAESGVVDMPVNVFDDDDGDYGGDDGVVDDDDTVQYAAAFNPQQSAAFLQPSEDAAADDFAVSQDADQLELLQRPEVLNVLKSTHATAPTQVDVVKLRRVMWHQTQRVLKQPPQMIMVPNGELQPSSGRFGAPRKKAMKRDRDEESSATDAGAFQPVPMHRFSEIVAGVLPYVSGISTTGTLSPAFLFFSLLFLANEHSILLENVPGDVQDIYITGSEGHPVVSAS